MSPGSQKQFHLIVCERTGHWAALLRAAMDHDAIPIVETRSWAACEEAVIRSPESLVAVEVTSETVERVLTFVAAVQSRFSRIRCVGLTSEDIAGSECLLREAGLVDIVQSTLEIPRLIRFAKRLQQHAPEAETDLVTFVDSKMPWSAFAEPKTQQN